MPRKTKPTNRFERCRQVLNWLKSEYPCGRDVQVKWLKEVRWKDPDTGKMVQCHGQTDRAGGSLIISLSLRKNIRWEESIETLIHEYTHCLLWGMAKVELHPKTEEHPPAFDAQDRAIYRRFNSGGGAEESNAYGF